MVHDERRSCLKKTISSMFDSYHSKRKCNQDGRQLSPVLKIIFEDYQKMQPLLFFKVYHLSLSVWKMNPRKLNCAYFVKTIVMSWVHVIDKLTLERSDGTRRKNTNNVIYLIDKYFRNRFFVINTLIQTNVGVYVDWWHFVLTLKSAAVKCPYQNLWVGYCWQFSAIFRWSCHCIAGIFFVWKSVIQTSLCGCLIRLYYK